VKAAFEKGGKYERRRIMQPGKKRGRIDKKEISLYWGEKGEGGAQALSLRGGEKEGTHRFFRRKKKERLKVDGLLQKTKNGRL